jgi:hypothetical protein
LYTPIVDAAGHVVGKNTETVTLPYGFKNIIINEQKRTVSKPFFFVCNTFVTPYRL